jgi:hypothetical protein
VVRASTRTRTWFDICELSMPAIPTRSTFADAESEVPARTTTYAMFNTVVGSFVLQNVAFLSTPASVEHSTPRRKTTYATLRTAYLALVAVDGPVALSWIPGPLGYLQ